MGHLNIYYDAVISCIRDAEAILVFGPGEAKGELKKRIKRNKLSGRIVGIETVDRMTHRQIAASSAVLFKIEFGNRIEIEQLTRNCSERE
jgi:hypothetical protein